MAGVYVVYFGQMLLYYAIVFNVFKIEVKFGATGVRQNYGNWAQSQHVLLPGGAVEQWKQISVKQSPQ